MKALIHALRDYLEWWSVRRAARKRLREVTA